ncbi:lymphoid enhancer-binding factor 1-like isoform X2 [Takifugu rubripes]|uniref:Lymphoid enhancer-binding factor 1-like n=1 Tax=Takifugu rubripes TaxID=31033 RepID=A0A674NUG2_TAKRU|nr:lymphoid enhancer-binding factor 1-like isoform X2 [Takifugu rubripes]
MNELGLIRVFANSSRPASPSFTDLLSVQSGEFDNFLHQEAVSYMTEYNTQREIVFYPGDNQLDPWNEGEYLYQLVGGDSAPPFGSTAASHAYNDPTAMMFPGVLEQKPNFLADLFEADLSTFPTLPSTFSAPPPVPPAPYTPHYHQQDSSSGESKRTNRLQKKEIYIKKPLNAFMLFMKDKRSTVRSSIRVQGSGAVNAFLGSVWKSLSREEQQKYFEEAEKQRILHQQQYPGWSTRDNYGKMRGKTHKKKLEVGDDTDESSESEAEESPPSKWMMMTPKYMEKLKASKSRTLRTKSHFQMNLRSRQPPNYQNST